MALGGLLFMDFLLSIHYLGFQGNLFKITYVVQNEFPYERYFELCYIFLLLYSFVLISYFYSYLSLYGISHNYILFTIYIFYICCNVHVICHFSYYFNSINYCSRLSYVFELYFADVTLYVGCALADHFLICFFASNAIYYFYNFV